MQYYLAIDIGASSGRHIVGWKEDGEVVTEEVYRCGGLEGRVKIALDYFDASINRISAWTVGLRNVQKALLMALFIPTFLLRRSLAMTITWQHTVALL